jgi:hypothetical protein
MEGVGFTNLRIEDGILYGEYPEGIDVDLDAAKALVRTRLEFIGDKDYPSLIDTTGVRSVTKEARDYFNEPEASAGFKAAAILSRSAFSTFLSNFFIKISLIKSPVPIKLFTTEEEALEWLNQYK